MSDIFNKIKQVADKNPDKLAIVEESGESLTYKQIVYSAEVFATNLKNVLDATDSRIAVCLDEGINIPVLVLAINLVGLSVVPINSGLKLIQISKLLDSVDADALIVDSSLTELFVNTCRGVKVVGLDSLFEFNGQSKAGVKFNPPNHYEEFIITLSSGSTGKPKPIILSEVNKIDRAMQAAKLYKVTEDDIVLCASPFFHSLGQRLTFLPLLLGATLVLLPKFSTNKWCKIVDKQKITFTISVSSHLHELIEPLIESHKGLISLRCLVSSSSAIDEKIKNKLITSTLFDFHEMYGATEIATATDLNYADSDSKSNSVGTPCEGVNIKIIDDKYNVCLPNQTGQIVVKSPLASRGYYRLPILTEQSFVDGYFLTGDLGYLDDDDYLHFVDRKKDIIISGGMNIFPSDIEAVIGEHPLVSGVVVIGIYDSYLVELPVAIVMCESDKKLVEREIRASVQQNLASYQWPKKYFFKDKFPLTATRKIDKIALRNEFNDLNLDLSSKLRSLHRM